MESYICHVSSWDDLLIYCDKRLINSTCTAHTHKTKVFRKFPTHLLCSVSVTSIYVIPHLFELIGLLELVCCSLIYLSVDVYFFDASPKLNIHFIWLMCVSHRDYIVNARLQCTLHSFLIRHHECMFDFILHQILSFHSMGMRARVVKLR